MSTTIVKPSPLNDLVVSTFLQELLNKLYSGPIYTLVKQHSCYPQITSITPVTATPFWLQSKLLAWAQVHNTDNHAGCSFHTLQTRLRNSKAVWQTLLYNVKTWKLTPWNLARENFQDSIFSPTWWNRHLLTTNTLIIRPHLSQNIKISQHPKSMISLVMIINTVEILHKIIVSNNPKVFLKMGSF